MTASFNRAAIEAHVGLLHQLADGCAGALTLVSIEEGKKTPRVRRFGVGQTTLMVDAIMGSETHPGLNIYAPWCVMRPDLEPGKKGAEADIVAVLGAVGDLDHDKYSIGELPLEAPYVVESSVGNYQAIYPFTRPLSVSEAKPIVVALSDAVGGDSATKDCSHIWRIPGTRNHPTKTKLARGRSPVPQPVTVKKPFEGVLIKPEELASKLPKKANGHASPDYEPGEALSDWEDASLRGQLTAIPADDYHTWIKVGMALHTRGLRDLWDGWSATSDKFDAAAQVRKWASFNAEREGNIVTTGTILTLAVENGWVAPPLFGDDLLAEDLKRSADRANGHEVLEPDDDEPDDETASDAGGSDDDDWAASIGLRSAAQFIDEYVPITYSIDGMLAEKALYFLTGRSGCGKTTISIAGGLAVANGDESILGVPVERGRVAYIAFENPDNFRQQLAIAVDAHCPAGVPDNFIVIDKDKPLENILGVLAAEARLNGDYQLVIIDSFQASFRGDDFNNNAQVLKHTRKLRRFTVEIPGCPTVLVLAHPVKNAGEDNLLPYGGNAILNEIDGNLTVWQMSDSPVTVHWQGKFRGHFDPLTFQLRRETSAKIYDKHGAPLPRPVAYRVLPDHADLLQDISEDLAIKLLRAIASNPGGTQRTRAEAVGVGQATVSRTLKKLKDEKLVTQTLGKWRLTPKGEHLIADPIDSSKATTKKAKKAAGAKAPKGNQHTEKMVRSGEPAEPTTLDELGILSQEMKTT